MIFKCAPQGGCKKLIKGLIIFYGFPYGARLKLAILHSFVIKLMFWLKYLLWNKFLKQYVVFYSIFLILDILDIPCCLRSLQSLLSKDKQRPLLIVSTTIAASPRDPNNLLFFNHPSGSGADVCFLSKINKNLSISIYQQHKRLRIRVINISWLSGLVSTPLHMTQCCMVAYLGQR